MCLFCFCFNMQRYIFSLMCKKKNDAKTAKMSVGVSVWKFGTDVVI